MKLSFSLRFLTFILLGLMQFSCGQEPEGELNITDQLIAEMSEEDKRDLAKKLLEDDDFKKSFDETLDKEASDKELCKIERRSHKAGEYEVLSCSDKEIPISNLAGITKTGDKVMLYMTNGEVIDLSQAEDIDNGAISQIVKEQLANYQHPQALKDELTQKLNEGVASLPAVKDTCKIRASGDKKIAVCGDEEFEITSDVNDLKAKLASDDSLNQLLNEIAREIIVSEAKDGSAVKDLKDLLNESNQYGNYKELESILFSRYEKELSEKIKEEIEAIFSRDKGFVSQKVEAAYLAQLSSHQSLKDFKESAVNDAQLKEKLKENLLADQAFKDQLLAGGKEALVQELTSRAANEIKSSSELDALLKTEITKQLNAKLIEKFNKDDEFFRGLSASLANSDELSDALYAEISETYKNDPDMIQNSGISKKEIVSEILGSENLNNYLAKEVGEKLIEDSVPEILSQLLQDGKLTEIVEEKAEIAGRNVLLSSKERSNDLIEPLTEKLLLDEDFKEAIRKDLTQQAELLSCDDNEVAIDYDKLANLLSNNLALKDELIRNLKNQALKTGTDLHGLIQEVSKLEAGEKLSAVVTEDYKKEIAALVFSTENLNEELLADLERKLAEDKDKLCPEPDFKNLIDNISEQDRTDFMASISDELKEKAITGGHFKVLSKADIKAEAEQSMIAYLLSGIKKPEEADNYKALTDAIINSQAFNDKLLELLNERSQLLAKELIEKSSELRIEGLSSSELEALKQALVDKLSKEYKEQLEAGYDSDALLREFLAGEIEYKGSKKTLNEHLLESALSGMLEGGKLRADILDDFVNAYKVSYEDSLRSSILDEVWTGLEAELSKDPSEQVFANYISDSLKAKMAAEIAKELSSGKYDARLESWYQDKLSEEFRGLNALNIDKLKAFAAKLELKKNQDGELKSFELLSRLSFAEERNQLVSLGDFIEALAGLSQQKAELFKSSFKDSMLLSVEEFNDIKAAYKNDSSAFYMSMPFDEISSDICVKEDSDSRYSFAACHKAGVLVGSEDKDLYLKLLMQSWRTIYSHYSANKRIEDHQSNHSAEMASWKENLEIRYKAICEESTDLSSGDGEDLNSENPSENDASADSGDSEVSGPALSILDEIYSGIIAEANSCKEQGFSLGSNVSELIESDEWYGAFIASYMDLVKVAGGTQADKFLSCQRTNLKTLGCDTYINENAFYGAMSSAGNSCIMELDDPEKIKADLVALYAEEGDAEEGEAEEGEAEEGEAEEGEAEEGEAEDPDYGLGTECVLSGLSCIGSLSCLKPSPAISQGYCTKQCSSDSDCLDFAAKCLMSADEGNRYCMPDDGKDYNGFLSRENQPQDNSGETSSDESDGSTPPDSSGENSSDESDGSAPPSSSSGPTNEECQAQQRDEGEMILGASGRCEFTSCNEGFNFFGGFTFMGSYKEGGVCFSDSFDENCLEQGEEAFNKCKESSCDENYFTGLAGKPKLISKAELSDYEASEIKPFTVIKPWCPGSPQDCEEGFTKIENFVGRYGVCVPSEMMRDGGQ